MTQEDEKSKPPSLEEQLQAQIDDLLNGDTPEEEKLVSETDLDALRKDLATRQVKAKNFANQLREMVGELLWDNNKTVEQYALANANDLDETQMYRTAMALVLVRLRSYDVPEDFFRNFILAVLRFSDAVSRYELVESLGVDYKRGKELGSKEYLTQLGELADENRETWLDTFTDYLEAFQHLAAKGTGSKSLN